MGAWAPAHSAVCSSKNLALAEVKDFKVLSQKLLEERKDGTTESKAG